MKDDPNDKVMADSVIAGNILNRIKERLGWDAYLF